MAWTFYSPPAKRQATDNGHYLNWTNTWTVTELNPVSASTIRLQVALSTQAYDKGRRLSNGSYASSAYQWYSEDTIRCGSESIPVCARYEILRASAYTAAVEVPASWNGRTIEMRIGWTSVRRTLNATILPPSPVTADDGVFGQGVAVTVDPAVTGLRHSLSVSCAGRSEQLLSVADTATAVTWTPAVAVYAPLLPNTGQAQAVFTCETFHGETSLGSTTKTITVAFSPGSLAPVCAAGWASAAPYNEGAAANFTVWVQGRSRAAVSFDPGKITCQYGAGVAGYTLRCAGLTVTASPWRTEVLGESTASLVCTVTDTRGQSASETLSVSLLPCAAPTITASEVFRCLADGTASEDGSCLAVKATALISPLGGENSFSLTASVRPLSGSFGAETALQSGVRAILSGCSPDTSYELRLTLTDALGGTARFTRTLPTRRWAMKFRSDGNGVAFGKAAEQNAALELADGWKLVLHDAQGNTAYLDYARLAALLGTIP